ncbi:MAG TPA: sulfite exporter TauE/SafE family protein [Actinomycetota bacterium]|nr:sulfite exporter TauE/SafE family protein [Actinomycetota bacterium]
MTPLRFVLGVLVGFVAGIGSGLFGVGGGVVTTPAVNVLLGGSAIEAVATPLPVIFPTSLVGAWTYYKAGEVSLRAAGWGALTGIPGAILGAYLTDFVNAHLLLFVTALLLGWTGYQVIRGRKPLVAWEKGKTPRWKYAAIGGAAGFTSGLLGVGGGIIMVPAFTVFIGMPLRRALGTSLVTISALVVPGTIVHWWLGHIDWAIFAALTVGVVPGARLGAKVALGVREQSLRVAVGLFLLVIALLYGTRELLELIRTAG